MIDSYCRALYQKVCVDPVAAALSKRALLPSHITAISLVSGVSIAFMLAMHWQTAALLMLLFSGYCDTLDGTLARKIKYTTEQGAVFDIISDRVVEFAVILGLFLYEPETRALAALFMLGSVLVCVTSFLVVAIVTPNTSEKSFYYSPGLMERSEAFGFFFFMILFPAAFFWLSLLFSSLVFFTAIVRVVQFYSSEK